MTRSAWIVLAVAVLIIAGLAFITQTQTLSDTQAQLATVQTAQADNQIQQATAAIVQVTQAAIVQAQAVNDTQQDAATVQAQALAASQDQAATAQAQALSDTQNEAATAQADAVLNARVEATIALVTSIAQVQDQAATAQGQAQIQAVVAENNAATATIAQGQVQISANIAATAQADLLATVSVLETQLAQAQAVTPLASTPTGSTAITGVYSDIPQSRLPDGGFLLGDPDASITIVEFGDYSFPTCQEYTATSDQFIDNYVRTGKARYEYRIFPMHGGELTYFLGQIQSCLEEQQTGAFWEARAILYELALAGDYAEETGRILTERLGLDYGQALECSASNTQVDTDVELAGRLNVQGTPAVLVRYGDNKPEFITFDGQTYNSSVPYEVLAAVVDANVSTTNTSTVSREGWQRIEGNDVAIQLPPTWFGGDLLQNPEMLADALEALGPEYAQFSQLLLQNPDILRLMAFDRDSPPQSIRNMNIIQQELPLSLTLQAYLDLAVPQIPSNFTVVENKIVEVNGSEVGRLIFSGDATTGNVKTLEYVIINGTRIWAVSYSTSINEFEAMLPIFEASFETFETQSSST